MRASDAVLQVHLHFDYNMYCILDLKPHVVFQKMLTNNGMPDVECQYIEVSDQIRSDSAYTFKRDSFQLGLRPAVKLFLRRVSLVGKVLIHERDMTISFRGLHNLYTKCV